MRACVGACVRGLLTPALQAHYEAAAAHAHRVFKSDDQGSYTECLEVVGLPAVHEDPLCTPEGLSTRFAMCKNPQTVRLPSVVSGCVDRRAHACVRWIVVRLACVRAACVRGR